MLRERPWIVPLVFFVLLGVWFGIWYSLVGADVAQVKASIDYQNSQFKAANPHMELRADAVSPTGFPFAFRVKLVRPTLSMIWQKETFAASLPELQLEKVSSGDGRYRLTAQPVMDALYAAEGAAPEKYHVTLSSVPKILLRAQGSSAQCPNMPGMRSCPDVAKDAPLISFAVDLPSELMLHVELNGAGKDVRFTFPSVGIPVFMEIPKDATGPLEIFVGMLREAMVYQGK